MCLILSLLYFPVLFMAHTEKEDNAAVKQESDDMSTTKVADLFTVGSVLGCVGLRC